MHDFRCEYGFCDAITGGGSIIYHIVQWLSLSYVVKFVDIKATLQLRGDWRGCLKINLRMIKEATTGRLVTNLVMMRLMSVKDERESLVP